MGFSFGEGEPEEEYTPSGPKKLKGKPKPGGDTKPLRGTIYADTEPEGIPVQRELTGKARLIEAKRAEEEHAPDAPRARDGLGRYGLREKAQPELEGFSTVKPAIPGEPPLFLPTDNLTVILKKVKAYERAHDDYNPRGEDRPLYVNERKYRGMDERFFADYNTLGARLGELRAAEKPKKKGKSGLDTAMEVIGVAASGLGLAIMAQQLLKGGTS